jgi:hypothetical protein
MGAVYLSAKNKAKKTFFHNRSFSEVRTLVLEAMHVTGKRVARSRSRVSRPDAQSQK